MINDFVIPAQAGIHNKKKGITDEVIPFLLDLLLASGLY